MEDYLQLSILLKKANVDYTVIGDGEIIVQNLIKQLMTGNRNIEEMEKVKGICFLKKMK